MQRPFEDLLLNYARAPDTPTREAIEREAWDRFGTRRTIFVLDMSGFSLLSRLHGIVHYLSMVRRMQLATQPVVEALGGRVVKFDADNCFAEFPSPAQAVRAALDTNLACRSMNIVTPDEQDIAVSIGIDEGLVLAIDGPHGPDFLGSPVNRAHKLGEDIAGPGEILVTREAFDLVPADPAFRATPRTLQLAGERVEVFSIGA